MGLSPVLQGSESFLSRLIAHLLDEPQMPRANSRVILHVLWHMDTLGGDRVQQLTELLVAHLPEIPPRFECLHDDRPMVIETFETPPALDAAAEIGGGVQWTTAVMQQRRGARLALRIRRSDIAGFCACPPEGTTSDRSRHCDYRDDGVIEMSFRL